MEFRITRPEDVATYVALGKGAQARLLTRGLGQYVPAAHDEYADAIRARVEAATLNAVWVDGEPVAFFTLEQARSPWWPPDEVKALYLAGMVVAPEMQGRGVGGEIIRWCEAEASRLGCQALRLDCHAGNAWLREYAYDETISEENTNSRTGIQLTPKGKAFTG